jgi:hypothetical protein
LFTQKKLLEKSLLSELRRQVKEQNLKKAEAIEGDEKQHYQLA